MKAFLDLIRWPNLIIVALTMILMRYAVIEPVLSKIYVYMSDNPLLAVPMTLQFKWYDFVLLVFATVSITAGGYVINDYFDIRTDLINKGRVIVGTKVSRRWAMFWHSILNIAGVIAGFYISWRVGYIWLGSLFLIVSGLLYFYSASYKRQFLIGNVLVALLIASVPLLVVLYEWPAVYRYYAVHAVQVPDFDIIIYWVGGFALFAFLTTLTREIIKDIEDFEGDSAYGRNTVPVIIGVLRSRIVSVCLILITIVLLYITWYYFVKDWITFSYMSAAITIPLLFVIYKVLSSGEKKDLHISSRTMKIVMMTGIFYSVIVRIILNWNLY
jgi:4-hydroxybenzoate polyprenyltransferase